MTQSLFNEPNEFEPFDPDKDYATELLGEGGKFYDADPEVAKKKIARAKAEADYTVKAREQELAALRKEYLTLREEYNAVPRLQELIDQALHTQQHASNENTHNVNDDTKPALSMDDIEGLLEKRDMRLKEQENFNTVQSKLVDRFGPNYVQHLKSQREQLGMTAEEADRMARTNPKAFERLFMPSQTMESFEAPPKSSIRNDNFSPRTQKRDWNYYENMRKSNDPSYWDPKTINQMHEDRKALGASFYG